MAILNLRAAKGWPPRQTETTFLVTGAAISSRMQRIDEEGPNALVQLREPVNRIPQFVRYAVQRRKRLCPGMVKLKLAHVPGRSGLHPGVIGFEFA